MKKLFVHKPLFRLFSPIFSGAVVYLLVLLLNNNVSQLDQEFLGEELYFCIGLSYIIQEFSRLLLLFFKKITISKNNYINLLTQVVFSIILCIVLVTTAISLYYKYVIGYSVLSEDLYMFNSIFAVITLIYVSLFISHQYLYKINSEKLAQEQTIKEHIEEEFVQFKREINPDLLFESFEALIVLMKKDKEKSDDFIDHMASIYRYILSNKEIQLISIQEELTALAELQKLANKLPYRNVKIKTDIKNEYLVVPASLLFVIDLIVRRTISSSEVFLEISLLENKGFLQISYQHQDKINDSLTRKDLLEIDSIYKMYSTKEISITVDDKYRIIKIPTLQLKE